VLNTTTKTQFSSFTHNYSKLFTLTSNDMVKPTLSQFRVPKLTQNVGMIVDTNCGWKQ